MFTITSESLFTIVWNHCSRSIGIGVHLASEYAAEGRFDKRGLILPDQYVNAADLISELRGLGIQLYSSVSGSSSWKIDE